jgi:hypothetical protein
LCSVTTCYHEILFLRDETLKRIDIEALAGTDTTDLGRGGVGGRQCFDFNSLGCAITQKQYLMVTSGELVGGRPPLPAKDPDKNDPCPGNSDRGGSKWAVKTAQKWSIILKNAKCSRDPEEMAGSPVQKFATKAEILIFEKHQVEPW